MNFIVVSDKNNKSKKISKIISNKTINLSFTNKKLIIVIGGDGFMLKTLKKYNSKNIIFYGINTGNYGFLMNKFSIKSFKKNISESQLVEINPLLMTVKSKNKKKKRMYAINEAYVLRQSKQAAFISVKKNSKTLIKQLVADGLIVSTPAGSTAYNLSVHGPILNLDSKKISVVPISPFRPRRWRGLILSDKSTISIKNLSIKKRPIIAVADNQEVKHAESITISSSKKIKFNLLFDKNKSLQKKIKIEQLRKEI